MEKKTLELFDCLVRHGGNKEHEIPKVGVTATEIRLLRAMHGDEAVLDRDIKPHKVDGKHATVEVDAKVELFELAKKYANTADPLSAKKAIEKAFGTALIGYEKWVDEALELERMEQEEGERRRRTESMRQKHLETARESTEAAAAISR